VDHAAGCAARYRASAGAKYPGLHLAGKTGTTNNNVDTWFAGIDGREVVITWVGRDNNQPTKLYGASGAMSIYQRYLANQSPVPLNLVAPEDIVDMGVDSSGNFVCGGGMRTLPVWTPTRIRCASKASQNSQRVTRSISLLSHSSRSSNSRSSRMRRKTAMVSQAGLKICSAVTNRVFPKGAFLPIPHFLTLFLINPSFSLVIS
jgi:membrane peptidoglycan carboxypeptidase